MGLSCLVCAGAAAETTVTGLEDAARENVLAYLDVDDLDCEADPGAVERALDRAPQQARDALNAVGFYDPVIAASLAGTDDCWLAQIDIDPGEPVRLRDVEITLTGEAAGRADFVTVRTTAALVPGSLLNHGAYDRTKRALLDLARERGFAEARFEESRLDIYPEELAADVSLRFSSGPRYSIGEVTVNQSELDPEFVDAYHEIMPGVPFDNRLLTSAFLELTDSGYFSTVDVQALPADAVSRTIPVEINLTPAPRRLVSYGIGYSTDTGPRLRFGRTIRRFNQQGHQLMLDAQISPVVSELTSIYRMPFGDPRYDWLSFSLGAKHEDTNTSSADSLEAAVRRVVDRSRGWSQTQSLSYVLEDFEVGSQTGRARLLIPGVNWTRIRGDDALRPTSGSKFYVESRAASDSILSDTSFVQVTSSIKWIRSMFERSRILLRGRAGYMVEKEFEKLPPSIRYFAGGDLSVRGFDYQSLGPVDQDGAVIGGNRLIELSVEFEREIMQRWSLAIFADSGNAFDERGLDLRTGAGIGARWRSPIGPVRIDVAWPVHDIEDGARLHITLGPDL